MSVQIYDTKQSDSSSDTGALVNAEHPFIAIAPWSTLVTRNRALIYGLNRTKLRTYAKLNCLTKLNSLKKKCFWQLNRTYI